MRRIGLCLAFLQCLLVGATLPATAQAAGSQPAVTVTAEVRGDVLIVDAVVRGGTSVPRLRMNPDPSFLEMAFPSSRLASAARTQAIDRGLIQRVQLSHDGSTSLARIFVLSKPRTEFTRTADGARYTIYLNQMAGTAPVAAPPATPPAAEATPAPTAAEPARTETQTPAPAKPALTEAQTQAPAEPARTEAQAPAPAEAASTEAPPEVAAAPPAPKPPAERPVTAVFQGSELSEALERLAKQAGMQTSIEADLPGAVTLSVSEMPFKDAVELLIQPYGEQLEVAWSPTHLLVRRSAAPAAPAATSGTSEEIAGEYFPFKSRDAQRMMEAARKAIPDLSYKVDPHLNVILVEGPPSEIERLKQLLDAMSPK